MKNTECFFAFFIVLAASVGSLGQQPGPQFFRIESSNEVVCTGMTADGQLSWSNQVADSLVHVEVADDLAADSRWRTYTHVLSTGHVGSVRLYHPGTPEGFSFIPAGTFMMGSPTNELGRNPDEDQHQVTLTRDFYMQRMEVTNRQMADVLNWALGQGGRISVTSATVRNTEGIQRELLDLDYSYCQISWDGVQLVVDAGKDEYPCIVVSWFGAQAYCNYLSDMEGHGRAIVFSDWSMDLGAAGYRLPTESEWEYACRASTATAFYTGGISYTGFSPLDPNLDTAGWYYGNSTNPDNPISSGKGTHRVGQKQANAWGLFDMHGNVREWCWDGYGPYPGTVTDPTGSGSGVQRVSRSGSWYSAARFCRSAARGLHSPLAHPYYLGFRPVRSAVP